jgi:hypothetical protein
MAGNFGSDIAFWVDDDISVGGAGASGGLGDGYLKFVNIGRFFKLPTDVLSLRIGQFELDLPFSQARSWNLSGWDIYDQANFGTSAQNVNNGLALSSAAQGVEFSGGHSYRGYHYSLAIVNQNTSGNTATPANVSPQVGFFSDSNFKDLYGRFSYRFNLEHDASSRNEIQAAGATGPRDHTYLTLGTLYFYGRSVQRATGLSAAGSRYKIAAIAFDEHIARLLRPVAAYLDDESDFDGISFSTTVTVGDKTGNEETSEAVEFFFPLSLLRCYQKYDCTGQQLIDGGAVLVNGERVSLDLQAAERS